MNTNTNKSPTCILCLGAVAAGAEHAAHVPTPPEDALHLRRHLPLLHPLPLLHLSLVLSLQRLHQASANMLNIFVSF